MRVDLRGNVKSVGSVFLTLGRNIEGRRLLRRTVVVEDGPPWHRGTGVGVLLVPGVVLTVGTWHPDPKPNLTTEAREAKECANRIPTWSSLGAMSLEDEVPPVRRALPDGWTIIPLEKSA